MGVSFNFLWAQVPENLDELFERKDRQTSATWEEGYLENNSYYYPLTVYPENEAGFDDDGYSIDRQFKNYGNSSPDNTVTNYHDQYIGGDGSRYFAMPSNHRATWWRIKTLGTGNDGGALYSGDDTRLDKLLWKI